MTIDNLIKNNGSTIYNGKTYVLIQQAYIDGSVDAPYYTASSICPEDGLDDDGLYTVYTITWQPTQDWLDSDRDDEGWACDWDIPDDVVKTGAGYDLDTGRII